MKGLAIILVIGSFSLLLWLSVFVLKVEKFQEIYLGISDTTKSRIKYSALAGIIGGLFFLITILMFGLLTPSYELNFQAIFSSFGISLLFGIIMFIGSYFSIARVRGWWFSNSKSGKDLNIK